MTTSRIPAVIDYLVGLFQNATTLGGPLVNGQQTGSVNVIDGSAVTADPGPLALWVGCGDIGATIADAATATQSWAALGRMARDEQLTIFCTAQAWSGSDDVRVLRLAAAGVVAAVEDLVRGDASLGGVVSVPGNAAVTGAQWQQGPGLSGDRGMAVRITFEITAQARIGG
jgi:hypothetical protein